MSATPRSVRWSAVVLLSLAGCKGCSPSPPAADGGAPKGRPDARSGHHPTPDARISSHRPMADARVAAPDAECGKTTLFTINHPELGSIVVAQADSTAFFYKSRLAIDADGAPNAYHPKPQSSLGLDYLANAGSDDDWWGIATDSSGNPYVQQSGTFAGYYVSTTALEDGGAESDPAHWVDSSTVPYISLPTNPDHKHPRNPAKVGDLAAVYSLTTKKLAYAVFADVGPSSSIGEGSIQLGDDLGTYAANQARNAKDGAGVDAASIIYVVFPGSRHSPAWPVPVSTLRSEAATRFNAWGGLARLRKCFPEMGGG
jgi:hypothetical protein